MRKTFYHNIVLVVMLFVNNFSLSQTVNIKGKVKYGNEVLASATVTIGTKTVLTDQKGEFLLHVKPGTITLTVTHAGYKKVEQVITADVADLAIPDIEMTPVDQLQEIILSSRSKNHRTYLDTPVPIDVYSGDRLVETGQVTLTQMLNFLAPSFTASREVLNEPATLRGLDPHHVLILINGIRYHPMVWYFGGTLRGQLGKGSVGNDLNSMPFMAIDKLEVLRDGAAAQYGSDAISGVINIRLKKNAGTSFQSQVGQFYKGDGEKLFTGIYHGFALKNKHLPADTQGHISLSAYYRNQEGTFRGANYEGLVYLVYPPGATKDDSINTKILDDQIVASRGFNRKAVPDNAGNTKFTSKGFSVNALFPVNNRTELFMTILVNSRKIDRRLFFRLPREGTRINYILYPDGVQPRGRSTTNDLTLIAGIRGRTKNDLLWDFSNSFGVNALIGRTTHSYNETQTLILGANAQSSFYNGTDYFKQLTSDINFSKRLFPTSDRFESVHLGWGGEWRMENYKTTAGEEASWKNYDPVHYPGVSVAGPENILNKSRHVLGAYAELESEFENSLLFNIAGRYEYYDDFGGNIAGKLAIRYKLSEKILLRASANNGFRAPALQQRYATSIGYSLNATREVIMGGLFPNDHEVIRALNVPILTAEKSVNVSVGLTAALLKNINLTIDAYWIRIRDRIVLGGNFQRRPGNTLDSIFHHFPDLNAVERVSFFSNAINTRTKGIDIVLDGNWSNKKESLGISLSANFSSTRVYGTVKVSDKLAVVQGSSNTLLNSEDRAKIEKGQPGSKIILSTLYKTGKLKLNIRNTRFGETMIAPLSLPTETFSPKILTDLSLTYSPRSSVSFTLGANNIGNTYPDRLKHYANTFQGGWVYSPEASPFSFNGGHYFFNMSLNF